MTAVVAATASLGVSVASAAPDTEAEAAGRGLNATLRYTENGIPHIQAATFASLGFGYGFAVSKDNLCLLADTFLTARAQRSRYLGPDVPATPTLGKPVLNLASDLYLQQIIDSGSVERLLAQPVPYGPNQQVRDLVRGYAAGFNRAVRETRNPRACGAVPLVPVTELEIYRHYYLTGLLVGQGRAIDGITSATPPTGPATAQLPADVVDRVKAVLADPGAGSNAIAIGGEGTTNGRGLLLGNPHFPWHGPERLWQAQLTIPGQLDVTGAGLLGLPTLQIGHTQGVAWSHTVATAHSFVLHQLKLAPGTSTSYLVDGKPEPMTSSKVGVDVRKPDGTVGRVERTLWSTRYGPVVNDFGGIPLPWSGDTAYVLRDVNRENVRGLNMWLEFAQAQSTKDILGALNRNQGAPWVNTIAADQAGNALYADVQVVPHLTDEQAKQCNTPLGTQLFTAYGLAVLDGSRAACDLGRDPGALQPGTFAPERLPVVQRRDYVANSNDSAWLTNAKAPLTGYPRIVGDVGTERGARIRMALTSIEQRIAGTDGLGRPGFSRQSMQDVLFSNRSLTAELTLAETARMCAAFPDGKAPTSDGKLVDVRAACPALAAWNGRFTVDGKGALLYSRYGIRLGGGPDQWLTRFDPADPVRTPRGLNTKAPAVQRAFGDAAAELLAAGIKLDAPLGDHQGVVRGGSRIPVPGAPDQLGVLNMIIPVWDAKRGATEVQHGSSFIQVVAFDGDRCPDTATLTTYSQSTDPKSPYYSDQTKLFAQSKWVRGRFCDRDIYTSPELRVEHVRER